MAFIAESRCWWLINKVVSRLDLCLFYALVLYFLQKMQCAVAVVQNYKQYVYDTISMAVKFNA